MLVFRRRLVFWLLKAYLRKWGKVLFISFVGGLIIFFALLKLSRVLVNVIPIEEKTTIGVVGAYTLESLPPDIFQKVSIGLTTLSENGTIEKGAASGWEIRDDGKTYVFTLRDDLKFSDGKKFSSETVSYDFTDVRSETPDDRTLVFKLKDQYSPFLVTVSRPILQGNLSGLGAYTIDDIVLNGSFIKSLTLVSRENQYKSLHYLFYPSDEALKIAFALGEIEEAHGLTHITFRDTSLETFPNISFTEMTNYRELVTLFFNNNDGTLSDPKLRKALTYALPNEFSEGERSIIPYPKTSMYAQSELFELRQDLQHAQVLLDATESATSEGGLKLTVKTLTKYKNAAETITSEWKKINVETTIEEVDSIPQTYQIYLGDFTIPKDPDQYTLWHSAQPNNITHYKNLRIDKLLEDGRKETDPKARMEIYSDFQRYLLEDSPAAFLYFPYEYRITKNK